MAEIEYHPLQPFLPTGCRILFLGSFPPPKKRWCMDFFYPNYINDHWRILGAVFFGNRDYFINVEKKCFKRETIIEFLKDKGIGYYDTASAVRRLKENASDQFLEVVEATDIRALLTQIPDCKAIVTTGEKAAITICQYFGLDSVPPVGGSVPIPLENIRLHRLPSSSRAYPLAFDKKVEYYKEMFKILDI